MLFTMPSQKNVGIYKYGFPFFIHLEAKKKTYNIE